MNIYRNARRYIPVLVLAVLILVSLACGETTPTSEPRVSTATPEAAETQAPSEQATNTPEPTSTGLHSLVVTGVHLSLSTCTMWRRGAICL